MIDVSGIAELAAQWRGVKVPDLVSPVLSKAGANMRDQMRADAPSGPHTRKYKSQLWFRKDGKMAVEAGAFGKAQGRLAAILEFGQGPNAPHPHILRTIDDEAPKAAAFVGQVLVEALT